ncbi:hypothetical protein BJV78DRAFT_1353290 [Lactifluus subvellereus]|nr:hypothetical protein BJV78DRAFT_1353290 [Lactifluus subvellereus]
MPLRRLLSTFGRAPSHLCVEEVVVVTDATEPAITADTSPSTLTPSRVANCSTSLGKCLATPPSTAVLTPISTTPIISAGPSSSHPLPPSPAPTEIAPDVEPTEITAEDWIATLLAEGIKALFRLIKLGWLAVAEVAMRVHARAVRQASRGRAVPVCRGVERAQASSVPAHPEFFGYDPAGHSDEEHPPTLPEAEAETEAGAGGEVEAEEPKVKHRKAKAKALRRAKPLRREYSRPEYYYNGTALVRRLFWMFKRSNQSRSRNVLERMAEQSPIHVVLNARSAPQIHRCGDEGRVVTATAWGFFGDLTPEISDEPEANDRVEAATRMRNGGYDSHICAAARTAQEP